VGASEEAGSVNCSLKLPLVQILVAVARIQRKGVFGVSVGSKGRLELPMDVEGWSGEGLRVNGTRTRASRVKEQSKPSVRSSCEGTDGRLLTIWRGKPCKDHWAKEKCESH